MCLRWIGLEKKIAGDGKGGEELRRNFVGRSERGGVERYPPSTTLSNTAERIAQCRLFAMRGYALFGAEGRGAL